jgi:methyl-accepting chemotaxis protein
VMRNLAQIRISTSLYLLFGVTAALLSVQAAHSVIGAFDQQRQAVKVEALAAANRDLFTALRMLRPEHGPVRVDLDAPNPADPAFIATLAPLRAKAAPALDALIAACSRTECSGKDDVGATRAALQKVAAMRPEVDAALRVPLAQRPPGIAKERPRPIRRSRKARWRSCAAKPRPAGRCCAI